MAGRLGEDAGCLLFIGNLLFDPQVLQLLMHTALYFNWTDLIETSEFEEIMLFL